MAFKDFLPTIALFGVAAGAQLIDNTRKGIEKLITNKSLASDILQNNHNALVINEICQPAMNIKRWTNSIFSEEDKFLDYYHIFDNASNLKYKIKNKYFILKSKVMRLYDDNNQEVGHINTKGLNNDNTDVKTCSIVTNDNKIINLKKYNDSGKIYAGIDQGNFNIEYHNFNTYEFKLNNITIGKLHITQPKKNENYIEKYVLEYENKEDEILGILLSIAIDLLYS